jgi:putative transposase
MPWQKAFSAVSRENGVGDLLYRNRNEARSDVVEYIEMFYNSQRRHSYLGYQNPNEFETDLAWLEVA